MLYDKFSIIKSFYLSLLSFIKIYKQALEKKEFFKNTSIYLKKKKN